MEHGSSHIRGAKRADQGERPRKGDSPRHRPARARMAGTARRKTGRRGDKMEDGTMETLEGTRQAEDGARVGTGPAEAMSERLEAVAAHPLAELLECPPESGNLLNGAARCIEFDAGEVVFHQHEICKGLYLVIGGVFVRKAERLKTRLTLGTARGGDLVELAAALGDGQHTYTLCAQTAGSLLLLPMESLNKVFEEYPPLRMRLLEELAREVSRAYLSCCLTRAIQVRRRGSGAEPASTGV